MRHGRGVREDDNVLLPLSGCPAAGRTWGKRKAGSRDETIAAGLVEAIQMMTTEVRASSFQVVYVFALMSHIPVTFKIPS